MPFGCRLLCQIREWSNPHNMKNVGGLAHVLRRATKLRRGLEQKSYEDLDHKSYEEQLKVLVLFSLEQRHFMGDLIALFHSLTGHCGEEVLGARE